MQQAGKGLAIKTGFANALTRDNDLIGFVDADMATAPQASGAPLEPARQGPRGTPAHPARAGPREANAATGNSHGNHSYGRGNRCCFCRAGRSGRVGWRVGGRRP